MKKITFVVLLLGFLYVFYGCASILPYAVSPSVYRSSEGFIVAKNNLGKETAITGIENERITQAIQTEWGKVAIAEIQGKSLSEQTTTASTISKDGVLGGFECLFFNDSRRKKTITVTKIGGFMNGQRVEILLTPKEKAVFKLPAGYYAYTWIIENNNSIFPENGPASFNVTTAPHYYDLETQKNYHGGVKLFGD